MIGQEIQLVHPGNSEESSHAVISEILQYIY